MIKEELAGFFIGRYLLMLCFVNNNYAHFNWTRLMPASFSLQVIFIRIPLLFLWSSSIFPLVEMHHPEKHHTGPYLLYAVFLYCLILIELVPPRHPFGTIYIAAKRRDMGYDWICVIKQHHGAHQTVINNKQFGENHILSLVDVIS